MTDRIELGFGPVFPKSSQDRAKRKYISRNAGPLFPACFPEKRPETGN